MKRSDWDKLLEEYHHRDCTQLEFCERRGIKKVTLQYHLSRQRKSQKFVPLSVGSVGEERVVLEFPGGLKLSIDAS